MNNKINFSTTSSCKGKNIKPAMEYTNADIQKLEILKDNKGKSGIYLWKNEKKNGKLYVGSSQNLTRRLRQYYNIDHITKNSNMLINRALLKEGYSSFSLYILEYCDKKYLIQQEQYYLDLLKPEYNILKKAGSSLGRVHTEETKAKIALALKGENNPIFGKTGVKHPMFGKLHSEDTRAKLSESQKQVNRSGEKNPMFGKPRAQGAGIPSQKIEVTDLTLSGGAKTTIHDSIRAAGRTLYIKHSIISMYFNRNQKSPYKGQYIFKRISSF